MLWFVGLTLTGPPGEKRTALWRRHGSERRHHRDYRAQRAARRL